MPARQFVLVLPLIAVWPAVMLSGWTTALLPVLLPAGLTAAALGGFFTYQAMQRSRSALLLLVVAIVALSVNFRVRDYGAAGLDWQNGSKLALWAVLGLVCAANWRIIARRLHDPAVALLTIFVGIACLSASYSVVPTYSAACALSLAAYLGFACLLAEECDERRVLQVLIVALAVYLLLNWVVTAVSPEVGLLESDVDGTRLQGVSGHPNSLARQANVFLCLVVGAWYRGYLGRRSFWALLVLGAATMLATDSRTSILALLAAAALVVLHARRLLLPGLAVLLMLVILAVNSADLSIISRSGSSGEVMTLTGRTELWPFVLGKVAQHPLLGHGLNSFEASVVDDWFGNPDAGVATHNNYLEVLFSCGIIGFVPYIAAMGILVRRWLSRPDLLRDLLVLDTLITGLTEVDLALAVIAVFALFLLIALDAKPMAATTIARQVCHA